MATTLYKNWKLNYFYTKYVGCFYIQKKNNKKQDRERCKQRIFNKSFNSWGSHDSRISLN